MLPFCPKKTTAASMAKKMQPWLTTLVHEHWELKVIKYIISPNASFVTLFYRMSDMSVLLSVQRQMAVGLFAVNVNSQ